MLTQVETSISILIALDLMSCCQCPNGISSKRTMDHNVA